MNYLRRPLLERISRLSTKCPNWNPLRPSHQASPKLRRRLTPNQLPVKVIVLGREPRRRPTSITLATDRPCDQSLLGLASTTLSTRMSHGGTSTLANLKSSGPRVRCRSHRLASTRWTGCGACKDVQIEIRIFSGDGSRRPQPDRFQRCPPDSARTVSFR